MDIREHIEENHAGKSAKYIKNIIYGGLDGIITTFAIIAASVGANLDSKYIIAIGFANLFADGISMGVGDYLSSYFEHKYILSEKEKEEYEFNNNKQYEIEEMVELYKVEGFEEEDSKNIVDILISKPKYKDIFIKNMMKLELDLEVPDDNVNYKKEGLITAVSFIIFGFIPVFTYLIFHLTNYGNYNAIFAINCVITVISLFSLGTVQAKITKQSWIRGGLLLTLHGTLASMVAYLFGWGIEKLLQ